MIKSGAAISLSIAFLLAACGTPQEQCIARSTRDLRVVEKLIAQTQTNLKRGYALEQVTISTTVWERCEPVVILDQKGKKRPPAPKLCLEDEEQTIDRPVAIDPAAEQRKLDGLLAKRRALLKAAQPVIAACKSQYPE
jgi:hypothetical protein